MRSRRGAGIFAGLFAVTIQKTRERSNGSSTKWSLNVQFCAGSSTSSSAADGSPWKSIAILSTSSSKNTGFFVPARRIPSMTRPGIAPT